MGHRHTLIRPLSPIEQAFTISNESSPLCIVCVLQLVHRPEPNKIGEAMNKLQSRHQLLRAGIRKRLRGYAFYELDPIPLLELDAVVRRDADSWREACERQLNSGVSRSGPLMRCCYVWSPDAEEAELLVVFHHAIADGTSARSKP